jgi:hypothetical protein
MFEEVSKGAEIRRPPVFIEKQGHQLVECRE